MQPNPARADAMLSAGAPPLVAIRLGCEGGPPCVAGSSACSVWARRPAGPGAGPGPQIFLTHISKANVSGASACVQINDLRPEGNPCTLEWAEKTVHATPEIFGKLHTLSQKTTVL